MVVEILVAAYIGFWFVAGVLALVRHGVRVRTEWICRTAFWLLLNIFLSALTSYLVCGFLLAEVFSEA